ncbi:MAG: hypothetical protein IJC68_02990, partial [Firmicutes bacterium]|nr:hypothetical protein [Bacillota bacterium]
AALLGYSIFGFSFLFTKVALDLTSPHFTAFERTYVMIGLGSAAFTAAAVSSVGAFLLINFAVNHISAFGVSWQKKKQES